MSIFWMALIGLGVLSVVVVYRLSVRPPRCPVCRIAADPVTEALLNSWPAVFELAYSCPHCGQLIRRHFVVDVTA
jgi:hypothetical protein